MSIERVVSYLVVCDEKHSGCLHSFAVEAGDPEDARSVARNAGGWATLGGRSGGTYTKRRDICPPCQMTIRNTGARLRQMQDDAHRSNV